MRIRRLLFIISGLIFLMMIAVSCTSESCLEETIPLVNGSFYKTGTDVATIADSITIYGAGHESSKIYNKARNISKISLPLDASSNSSTFIIKINNTIDTLRLYYTSYPSLISRECGISFFFNLESYHVYGNKIDTIYFPNKNITTLHGENLKIFY